MPRVSLWFFAVAPIYVLIGMGFGIFMGATENFTLAMAHAHLNLIGWVTMALYGTFYALAREASTSSLHIAMLIGAGLLLIGALVNAIGIQNASTAKREQVAGAEQASQAGA